MCLLVFGSFLSTLPLQAGPFQSEGAKSPSVQPAKDTETKDPYSNLFPEVVATVNGKSVYGRELEGAIRNELISIGSPRWTSLKEDYRGQLVYNSITSIINSALVYAEAVAAGIGVTDAEVQDEYLKMTQMFKNDAEMNAYLKSRHTDQETVVAEIQKSLVVSKYIDETIRKKISVTPKEMSDYYAANPNAFRHPDIVRTSQILIESGDTPASDAKARQLAETALERAQKGEDFGALAREYSMSLSASQGGDVGFSDRASLAPEYADVAFSLPVGGVKMVKIPEGYRIIKVTDKKKEGKSTLQDAEASLLDFLSNEKAQIEITKLINRLRDKSEIEILIPSGVSINP